MLLTPQSEPNQIQLHPYQWEVYKSKSRFRIVVAGRRFGKTHLALAEMIRAARAPGRIIWYVGPNDGQCRRIVWDRLKEMTRPWWSKRPNEEFSRIDLVWGSSIFVNGAYKPDSLRGPGIDFLVIDEFSLIRPSAWQKVFRPALSDRNGRVLIIGTPEGLNHFYELYQFASQDPDWSVYQFTTAQGGLVDAKELESAARDLDTETYRREYCGDFMSTTRNRAYYAFNRVAHVQTVDFDGARNLIWSLDFNVNPMAMLLMQRREDDSVYVLEEMILPDAHTEAACQAFLDRAMVYDSRVHYLFHPLIIEVYGDASGNQRRTSGAYTDWMIIRKFFSLWRGKFEPRYFAAKSNPFVRDRVNCVNSRLCNHLEETRIFINPSCTELIKDLEQVTWAVDKTGAVTTELNKSDKARTHVSDALGYYLSEAFPLKPSIGHQSQGRIM